jgi:hypothetical protein
LSIGLVLALVTGVVAFGAGARLATTPGSPEGTSLVGNVMPTATPRAATSPPESLDPAPVSGIGLPDVLAIVARELPAGTRAIDSIRLVRYCDTGLWAGITLPDRWVWVVEARTIACDRAAMSPPDCEERLVIDLVSGEILASGGHGVEDAWRPMYR